MKLQSIQVLRGLAAFLVVIYHIRSLEGLGIAAHGGTELPFVGGLFTNGYAGVDLFFVISGFIMVYVTQGLQPGARASVDFLFARATRIYPVWWFFAGIMTAYMIVAHGLNAEAGGWAAISRTEPLIPYLLKSFALVPQPEMPILGVGWTLVHEMYFYLVFSLILLAPRRWWPGLLLVWGSAVVAGSVAGLSGAFANELPALAFYPMTMEFILGAVVGLVVTSGVAWRPGLVTLGATLWLLASLCYQGIETAATLQWGRVVWFGLPCAVLIYGFATLDLVQRLSWLVPAILGAICGGAVYQLYGLLDTSPDDLRLAGTILAVTVGAITMAITLWFGWLGGQAMPDRLLAIAPWFQRWGRRLARLGDWSFSLYLCHMLVLSLLRRVFHMLGNNFFIAPVFHLGNPGRLDNIAFLISGIVLSIVAAALAYRFIERPCIILFGRLRERLFHRTPVALQPA
ncbi:acyltransferase family protein [Hyphomonas johnsonii]|uniref:Putative exopolysaccharide production protein ExoZ n=1 Tax=Hyphomonas johnsonii MHS-2 TaxID=1280950 RepID=A0A059F9V6_9PROT|nr:acyltransferase [Hyphomonas johnsonii]KCZ87323.1 putative exopolysaccharide production protein ExoZ [Hyphomonas johnsonii MHS-2]